MTRKIIGWIPRSRPGPGNEICDECFEGDASADPIHLQHYGWTCRVCKKEFLPTIKDTAENPRHRSARSGRADLSADRCTCAKPKTRMIQINNRLRPSVICDRCRGNIPRGKSRRLN